MTSIETLRFRAAWREAAARLVAAAEVDAAAAAERATVLVERTAHTGEQWQDAETAVAHAEKLAVGDAPLRADAALARSYLAYSKRIYGVEAPEAAKSSLGQTGGRSELRDARETVARIRYVNDLNKEAVDAVNLADDLLAPNAPRRALVLFRSALIQRNIIQQSDESVATLRSAHERAIATENDWLLAQTTRQLAIHAHAEGNDASARQLLVQSLRYAESSGWQVGQASALTELARASEPAEAQRLRAQAARLITSLDEVPVWLRDLAASVLYRPLSLAAKSQIARRHAKGSRGGRLGMFSRFSPEHASTVDQLLEGRQAVFRQEPEAMPHARCQTSWHRDTRVPKVSVRFHIAFLNVKVLSLAFAAVIKMCRGRVLFVPIR